MGIFNRLKIRKESRKLHKSVKYNNINDIIDKRALEINNEISEIIETITKSYSMVSFSVHEKITAIIREELPKESIPYICIEENTNDLTMTIDNMFSFYYYESYLLIDFALNKDSEDNSFIRKNLDGDGQAYATSDRTEQDILNTIKILKTIIKAKLIELIQVCSNFSPMTVYELESLDYYESLIELERSVDKKKDIFYIIGEEMDRYFNYGYLDKVITFKAFKIFKDRELKDFRIAITENYIYLLTKIPTKETYFMSKLFNGALLQYADFNTLKKIRENFTKYIFKREHDDSIGYAFWYESIISLNKLKDD